MTILITGAITSETRSPARRLRLSPSLITMCLLPLFAITSCTARLQPLLRPGARCWSNWAPEITVLGKFLSARENDVAVLVNISLDVEWVTELVFQLGAV